MSQLQRANTLVVPFGKTSLVFCQYLQSNLKLPLCICSNLLYKGNQIKDPILLMKNTILKNEKSLLKTFPKLQESKNTLSKEFKLFFIVDTSDWTMEEKRCFCNKEMFSDCWFVKYVEPIFVDDFYRICLNTDISCVKKDFGKIPCYYEILPILKDVYGNEKEELKILISKLEKCKKTNLVRFFQHCLKLTEENTNKTPSI